MLLGLDLAKNCRDPAVTINYEGASLYAHGLFAHEILFHPNVVILNDLARRIGKQGKGKLKLVDKPAVTLDGVGTDSEHHRAIFQLAPEVSYSAGLRGASGRIVLWIKIKDQGFAAKIRQRYFPAGTVFAAHRHGAEIRRRISDLKIA